MFYFLEIIATAERTDIAPQVKDGYIMMFIYMPGVFNDDFIPYINQIITPILKVSRSIYYLILNNKKNICVIVYINLILV